MKFLPGLLCCLLAQVAAMAQVVKTREGYIEGKQTGGVYEFLGVPFAKPPVFDLRWKDPLVREPWSDTLSTIAFAPVCPQKRYNQGDTTYTIEGEEDCLYLNIWTPQPGLGNRPVLVFIHGGGNQQGGASQQTGGTTIFSGKNMAERGDVVVVTLQYRIGPLGFLVHPGLENAAENRKSGNYGALDQLLALRWIKQNITQFGGDSTKVMMFGESAGGVNTGNLLVSPLAKDLFQRACIQSAIPLISTYDDSRLKGEAYVDSFINTGSAAAKMEYMRQLHKDSLLKFAIDPLAGGIVQLNWQPTVDGYVFTHPPAEAFEGGNFNRVPLIIGSNAEEMSLSAPPTVFPFMVNALIDASVPANLRSKAYSLYPAGTNGAQARQSYIDLLTDAQFTAGVRRTAQLVSRNQEDPVWRYFFSYKHALPSLVELGSYHGMELFYVFNNWENATLGKGVLFRPSDDSVQKNMLRYWVNFARTGNPNQQGLPQWPVYKSGEDCYLEIKATPDASQCGLRTPQSNLWDDVVGFVSDNTAPHTRQPGHWHNEATWNTYRVPDGTSKVVVNHALTISNHATCKSLMLQNGAVVELLAGIKLEVLW